MRATRVSAPIVIGGLALLWAAAPPAGAAPVGTGNCVSYFTSTLGQAGVAGSVISFGAKDLAPFGRNAVSLEAHAELGSCPFVPEMFLPPS